MTKTEARAVLTFQAAVREACSALENRLTGQELEYAQRYYLTHVRGCVDGHSYGGAPINAAETLLEYD